MFINVLKKFIYILQNHVLLIHTLWDRLFYSGISLSKFRLPEGIKI